jgi:predicted RecB family nuclease
LETDTSDYDKSENNSDPVWEACCVLDQLERLEQQARNPSKAEHKFGRMQSVSWLDALTKARNEAILEEFFSSQEVSYASLMFRFLEQRARDLTLDFIRSIR